MRWMVPHAPCVSAQTFLGPRVPRHQGLECYAHEGRNHNTTMFFIIILIRSRQHWNLLSRCISRLPPPLHVNWIGSWKLQVFVTAENFVRSFEGEASNTDEIEATPTTNTDNVPGTREQDFHLVGISTTTLTRGRRYKTNWQKNVDWN